MFDVIEVALDWESQNVLKFDFDMHERMEETTYAQIVDIGYESHNSILLLNTLAIMTTLYFLQVVVLLIVSFTVFLTSGFYGRKA